MSASEEDLVGHSYTRARKHPLVVGKLPGAGRLPGGPYTITQIVTMVVTFTVLAMTQALWAHFGLMNILIMVAVPWGLAWVLRYARMDGRDPARALRSLLSYASAPPGGRMSGRPQRTTRPRLATGTCTVRIRTRTTQEPAPAQASARRHAAAPAPASRRPNQAQSAAPARRQAAPAAAPQARTAARTGLQSLLASLDEH